MRSAKALAKLVRERRAALGLRSAASLARKAGLSVNYISILERGERLPRWDTVETLADALELQGAARGEFFRAVDSAGKPKSARLALTGLPFPGLAVWKTLPHRLLSIHDRSEICLLDRSADQLVADLVCGFGPLLAWLALSRGSVSRARRAHLRTAAERAFNASGMLTALYPNRAPAGPGLAFNEAASFLPLAWRDELFRDERETARLTRLLKSWDYSPRPSVPSRLSVRLRDAALDQTYCVNYAQAERIAIVHDAMIAHRLWSELGLTTVFGTAAASAQQSDLAALLSRDIPDVLGITQERVAIAWKTADSEERDRLYAATQHVDLAVRLYELPDLAAQVLPYPRDTIEAALTLAANELGGLSPRFPGAPWPGH